MQSFTYHVPTEIVFGKEAQLQTAAEIKKYGGSRVLLVSGGHSAERSGLLSQLRTQLAEAGLAAESFGGVQPNPRVDHARAGVRQAVQMKADFILAVGGGSVIDTAKAIAHGAANPGTDLWQFWLRNETVTKSLPVGVVLTIAAAGSETSDSAVLTDEESGVKRGLSTPFNRPAFAVLNPELTMTLPLFQVTCGIVDIMMHTMDRYFNPVRGNELTDALAEAVLRTTIANGRRAVADRQDYDAMSELMWCGSVSHNGLTGLGGQKDFAPHQLGHELSARFDVAHGASLSAVWGAWAAVVFDTDPARFAQFGRNVWGLTGRDDAALGHAAVEATVAYFKEISMPTCFTELGIGVQSEEALAQMADAVTYHGKRKIGTFLPMGGSEIFAAYRNANR